MYITGDLTRPTPNSLPITKVPIRSLHHLDHHPLGESQFGRLELPHDQAMVAHRHVTERSSEFGRVFLRLGVGRAKGTAAEEPDRPLRKLPAVLLGKLLCFRQPASCVDSAPQDHRVVSFKIPDLADIS